MYIIIVGCGSLGAGLARELSVYGHDVVVVDKDSSAFRELGTEFNGITVLGTGIDEDVLKKAGIEDADVFVAVTSTDSVNIMAAQVAKYIFKVKKVIARVYNTEKDYVYSELGLETICPISVSIDSVKGRILSQDLNLLMQVGFGDTQVIEISASELLEGKDIYQIEIPHKFKVFGVVRGSETLIPDSRFRLEKGDKVIAIVRIDAIETVSDLFIGSRR
jgi:trk system potassium uptake protein TrkA